MSWLQVYAQSTAAANASASSLFAALSEQDSGRKQAMEKDVEATPAALELVNAVFDESGSFLVRTGRGRAGQGRVVHHDLYSAVQCSVFQYLPLLTFVLILILILIGYLFSVMFVQIYSSLVGVKVLNIHTNQVVRTLGSAGEPWALMPL